MRLLQILAGAFVAMGILWAATVLWYGHPFHSNMPPMLGDLPWSGDADHPAHVPTSLLAKPCGSLESDADLVSCLQRNGMRTGQSAEGEWASFDAGFGFDPTTYRLSWKSDGGALPAQIDATHG